MPRNTYIKNTESHNETAKISHKEKNPKSRVKDFIIKLSIY